MIFCLIFFLFLDLNQPYEFKLTNPEANSKDTMISLETIFCCFITLTLQFCAGLGAYVSVLQ